MSTCGAARLGDSGRIEFGELVILGAHQEVAQLRPAREDTVARRRRLAGRIRARDIPVDLLVAALADRHALSVLHYDRDYDLISDKTDLEFASIWLAPAGAI